MPRKSAKSPPGTAQRSTSKRPAADIPSRASKRARATARKSYVELDSDSDADPDAADYNNDAESGDASDFEAQSEKEATSESEQDDDISDDEPTTQKGRPRGRFQKKIENTRQADEKELWKPGAKLEPGTRLIIKKPKARDAGDIPYTEGTIHPNTMLFLKEIKANNDRQWLKYYRVAVQDFSDFISKLTERIVEIDETIPELPVKDIIQPNGGSFVGGGLWQPEAESLSKLRREIDRRSTRIKQVLTNERIRRAFLAGAPDDEKKAVKAFIGLASNASTALKRHPKDFPMDHKDIELLRLRSFTLGKKLSDDEVVGPKGIGRIAELIACIEPFITYLNSVVMPDEDSSSSSDGVEEDESDGASSAADGADE
ncbi:hypothetical protein E8E12_011662 [Didymella heteroderae]|uniref:Uncharacterized protein n=1 Tax=Didymella heteroderae TaxID=1769908 RepID=A0A9P5C5L3_9PLEO|nr:hypothetical protein E8E12_011662 [Didymella heteroderae]